MKCKASDEQGTASAHSSAGSSTFKEGSQGRTEEATCIWIRPNFRTEAKLVPTFALDGTKLSVCPYNSLLASETGNSSVRSKAQDSGEISGLGT